MSQWTPRRSSVVPAFLGGAFAAVPTAALLEISLDNGSWLPVRIVAGAAAALVCIGTTGAFSRAAARHARDSLDGRVGIFDPDTGEHARGFPLSVQTTRDLTFGALDQSWSGRVEYATYPHRTNAAPYTTVGQLDVDRGHLPALGYARKDITEMASDQHAIRVDGSETLPSLKLRAGDIAPADIPPQRRFRGVDRVRRSTAAPMLAFLVGFGGVGYGVHQYFPDTSGISASVQSVFESSDESGAVSGNAEENLKSALENAEEESPGATTRLTYISISDTSDVSVRYFDPETNRETQIYDEGDPADLGRANSRDTFTFTVDQIPPLNSMRETAVSYFDILWNIEIEMPDDNVILPSTHVDGEPIVELASRGTDERYNYLQATLDGTFAPIFDSADLSAAYGQLVTYMADHGVDASQPVFEEFGLTGPYGGTGDASVSSPGSALWASLGPGTPLGAGDFGVASGVFPTFNPSDAEWSPEQIAALLPLTAVDPEALQTLFDAQAAEIGAEPTDIEASIVQVSSAEPYDDGDPATIKIVVGPLENSTTYYTLDGQKLPDE